MVPGADVDGQHPAKSNCEEENEIYEEYFKEMVAALINGLDKADQAPAKAKVETGTSAKAKAQAEPAHCDVCKL